MNEWLAFKAEVFDLSETGTKQNCKTHFKCCLKLMPVFERMGVCSKEGSLNMRPTISNINHKGYLGKSTDTHDNKSFP